MYTLDEYGDMIADGPRFTAYADAIARVVQPGDSVVDIGCGPGTFALLACRAGARRVYAIEPGEIRSAARQVAVANGFEDRIVFYAEDSRQIELPERVRVILSDLRGTIPFFSSAIASFEDARKRFLAPGGVVIPQKDTLYAAIVEDQAAHARITTPWGRDVRGIDFSSVRELLNNAILKMHCKREQLLTEPQSWCVLDYASGASPRASGEMKFHAARPGVAHGICLWFEAQLWEELGYSAAPGHEESVYGQVFLPWPAPVSLAERQAISVELHVDPVGEDYIWRWSTVISPQGAGEETRFVQSTFYGTTFMPDALRRRTLDYVPRLSEMGEADRWLLEAIDGERSMEEIGRAGAARFPRHFANFEDALRRVTALAEKYAR